MDMQKRYRIGDEIRYKGWPEGLVTTIYAFGVDTFFGKMPDGEIKEFWQANDYVIVRRAKNV